VQLAPRLAAFSVSCLLWCRRRPMAMETTYTWTDEGAGTRMRLRNRGGPSGFAKITAPIMAAAVRRATTKDLARLKEILEAQA
jgi:hypothetical protein